MNSKTRIDLSLLIVRVTLSMVVLGHGTQKLFGWFGGYGFEGTVGFFTETIGLPYVIAVLIIIYETLGMILLLLGVFSRTLAAGVIVIMAGAIITLHGKVGFFMNWSGTLPGEGYEYHLLAIALALVTLLNGGGAYSFDAIEGRIGKQPAKTGPSKI